MDSLNGAQLDHYSAAPHFKVESAGHFEEMRNYLIAHYANIEVPKSFEDHNGQIWDCIPVEQQPSLKRSGKPPAKAPAPPAIKSTDSKPPAQLSRSFLSEQKQDKQGNQLSCPPGHIPVRRVVMDELIQFKNLNDFRNKTPRQKGPASISPLEQDTETEIHKYAHAAQTVDNLGGHSFISIWQPPIVNDQVFSLLQQWYVAGDGDQLQTAEAGWQVYPGKYKTAEPCLFIYWTADNYKNTGYYNLDGSGFVQTNNKWALGGPLTGSISSPGGPYYELEITWSLADGNWWLYINGLTADDAVGYLPVAVYQGGPLATNASVIDYGGETVGSTSWPPMGSSEFANQGSNGAAWQRGINYFDPAGASQWANLTKYEDFPNCYTIDLGSDDSWGTYFYLGGPGGNNC